MEFGILITEDVGTITQLDFGCLARGFADSADGWDFYILVVGGGWEWVADYGANGFTTLTGVKSSGFGNYIDGSGYLYLKAVQKGIWLCNIKSTIDADYVYVTVTYSAANHTISGWVKTAGGAGIISVVMGGLPNTPSTDINGYYSDTVSYGWSGTVTPSKAGYTFDPTHRDYSNVTSDQANQDYTGTPTVTAPTITISAATLIGITHARLNGDVTATGGEDPSVLMYWGKADGGQTPGNWANSSAPTSPGQPQGVAPFYLTLGYNSLDMGALYYFSAKATNSGGTGWPAASLSFSTRGCVQVQMVG
jgi:hypothetical protein